MRKLGVVVLLCGLSLFCFEVDEFLQEKQIVAENKLAKDLESK